MVLLLNAHLVGLMIVLIYQAVWKLAVEVHINKTAELVHLKMELLKRQDRVVNMDEYIQTRNNSKCSLYIVVIYYSIMWLYCRDCDSHQKQVEINYSFSGFFEN